MSAIKTTQKLNEQELEDLRTELGHGYSRLVQQQLKKDTGKEYRLSSIRTGLSYSPSNVIIASALKVRNEQRRLFEEK